jgi:glycosyltransferase involved in cell wall biosynthesis/predicted metal-dependent phosphoesterase TrpH
MAKADLHLHSRYSEHPSEWFLQRLGAGESYTEPDFIYDTLLERGMDFITITDHNRIDGAVLLQKKHPDRVFVSMEATAYFPEDNTKIHVLVYGLDEEQYNEIQRLRVNIYHLRDFLKTQRLAHSVAHPTYSIDNKLRIDHLERLMLLFDTFEGVNGGRNLLNNQSWRRLTEDLNPGHFERLYRQYGIEPFSDTPWVKSLTGGSDDHAGLFLGQTWTTVDAKTPEEFLEGLRTRKCRCDGRHSDYQSLVFSIYKIGWEFSKSQGPGKANPLVHQLTEFVFKPRPIGLVQRLKLWQWKSTGEEEQFKRDFAELCELLEKARNDTQETRLKLIYSKLSDIADSFFRLLFTSFEKHIRRGNLLKLATDVSSSIPGVFLAVPFFSAINHLFRNRGLLQELELRFGPTVERTPRILWFSDTLDDLNGVSVTLREIRAQAIRRELPITVVGSREDGHDEEHYLNLPHVHRFQLPYYETYSIGIPSVLKALEKIYAFAPDRIYISTPGPVGLVGLLAAKLFHIPAIGIYHTDFTMQAHAIKEDESLRNLVDTFIRWFYQQMDEIKAPTREYIDILERRGFDRLRMSVFRRGLDTTLFAPRENSRVILQKLYDLEEGMYFLYTGRISREKNLDVIMEAFRGLRNEFPDAYLIVVGEGPLRSELEARSEGVIFTGRVDWKRMPDYYAGCDCFLFPSISDTYGMSVLEAQSCGLPALVSNQGGPRELVRDGVTGRVLPDLNPSTWQAVMEDMTRLCLGDEERMREMRAAARQNAVHRADWDKFFDSILRDQEKYRSSQ